jgi:hypothetical protein
MSVPPPFLFCSNGTTVTLDATLSTDGELKLKIAFHQPPLRHFFDQFTLKKKKKKLVFDYSFNGFSNIVHVWLRLVEI